MTEPGDECPECGRRLRADTQTCDCGWTQRRPTTVDARMLCQDCHEPTNTGQGAIVVDERFLCLTCRMARLKRNASRPEDPCTEEGCTKTAGEHIAEFRALVDQLMARMIVRL